MCIVSKFGENVHVDVQGLDKAKRLAVELANRGIDMNDATIRPTAGINALTGEIHPSNPFRIVIPNQSEMAIQQHVNELRKRLPY